MSPYAVNISMTNFDKKIRLYFIEMGYIPATTKAEFMYLSKLLSNDMQQQDSQIPMQGDQDNKKSNAIELDNEGFDALYAEIKKQDARGLKKILKSVELEKSNHGTDQDNE